MNLLTQENILDQTDESLKEGILITIDKPIKWTSFDVVKLLRYHLPKKIKVGHAGTLDPLATGLLIVAVGRYTKKISEIQQLKKYYSGNITLGASTPSFDSETEVDQTFEFSHLTEETINKIPETFLGEQIQATPAYSAARVEGKRAYQLARKGIKVKPNPRLIMIHSFDILGINLPEVTVEICCSKGTYIRAVAHDFGKRLKNAGYLSKLVRTGIGDYHLDQAWELDDLIKKLKTRKSKFNQ